MALTMPLSTLRKIGMDSVRAFFTSSKRDKDEDVEFDEVEEVEKEDLFFVIHVIYTKTPSIDVIQNGLDPDGNGLNGGTNVRELGSIITGAPEVIEFKESVPVSFCVVSCASISSSLSKIKNPSSSSTSPTSRSLTTESN